MATVKSMFKALLRDEQGGEVLEYALIAGLIISRAATSSTASARASSRATRPRS